MIRQIAPRCPGSQDPEDAIEDTTVVHPRNATRLVRQHRLDGNPFMIGEFVAHDSSPQLGSLNHAGSAKRNAPGRHRFGAYGQKRTSTCRQPSLNPSKMSLQRHLLCAAAIVTMPV